MNLRRVRRRDGKGGVLRKSPELNFIICNNGGLSYNRGVIARPAYNFVAICSNRGRNENTMAYHPETRPWA
jgi:hypothetical protein